MIQIHSIRNGIFPIGTMSGTPCIVINVGGCNLHCPFCDFPYDNNLTDMDDDEIFKRILHEYYKISTGHTPRILIAGGEPGLWDFMEIIEKFRDYEFTDISVAGSPIKSRKTPQFFVATNGLAWQDWFDYTAIMLSPKTPWLDMAHNTKTRAAETHFLVGEGIEEYWREPQYSTTGSVKYLIPKWEESKFAYNKNISKAFELVRTNISYRFSLNLNHYTGGRNG